MMSSNSNIPNWNLIQQSHHEQSHEEEDSSHMQLQNHQNHSHFVSMSNDRIRELIWENGQPTESGFCGMSRRSGSHGGFNNDSSGVDTLESIVDQATKNGHHQHQSIMGCRKWEELVENNPAAELLLMKKRLKSSQKYQSSIGNNNLEYNNCEVAEGGTCDTTTTMIMESICNKKSTEEDSATCHAASEKQDSENERKDGVRSHQTRSSRAADTHKQSERKRRDRINQKMKALQKLVPNACKTDKASMLDEVIEYMKQLKAQVNLMVSSRSVHDQMTMMMMMPSLGMQQQLQVSSLLARLATTTSPLHHQSFLPFIHPGIMTSQAVPPAVAPPPIIETPRIRNGATLPHNNEYYNRFLAQSMRMDVYNNMMALCTQQAAGRSRHTSNDEAKYVHRQL